VELCYYCAEPLTSDIIKLRFSGEVVHRECRDELRTMLHIIRDPNAILMPRGVIEFVEDNVWDLYSD